MNGSIPFPLPLGHVFGPRCGDLRYHDGRVITEGLALRHWQCAYTGLWRRPKNRPSGLYDAQTQAAVCEVQRVAGLPVTGLLGPEEWAAVWSLRPPAPVRKPRPEPTPLSRYAQRVKRERVLDYFRRYSEYKIRFGNDPNAPPWYPGRPFGPHERGSHIARVQELFGMKPTGRYTATLVRRVRGFQRAHALPETGIMDVRTAILLDPPPGRIDEKTPR